MEGLFTNGLNVDHRETGSLMSKHERLTNYLHAILHHMR